MCQKTKIIILFRTVDSCNVPSEIHQNSAENERLYNHDDSPAQRLLLNAYLYDDWLKCIGTQISHVFREA